MPNDWHQTEVQGRNATLAGTNLENAKQHNRRVVLEALRLHGELSRADLKRLTRLSTQTVSNIADEFIERSLFVESDRRPTARGKPPRMLSINAKGAYSIGLQLDHRKLIGVLLDLGGEELARTRFDVSHPNPEEGLPALEQAVAELITKSKVERSRICGIGVVMPGPFNVNEIAASGPTVLPNWQSFPLVKKLSQSTGLPVYLENDATAAAMGESYFGAAKGMRTFACVYIGTGLGGGLVIEGRPIRGKNGNAGEIGHVSIFPDGKACYCGNTGCAEQYLSLHSAYECLGLNSATSNPDSLETAFENREPKLFEWMQTAGLTLKLMILGLENTLDPETVVITGYMPEKLLDQILRVMEPLARSVSAHDDREIPRVLIGTAGDEVAALGAAVFPLLQSFGLVAPVLGAPNGG
ncbi:ROK family protein [Hoeflea sp. G2-23]|uniref:ROK family protein n=1 Tax=Hoeflea algicola TaxID=2983763 RepID=A0ABT3Z9Q8_9HYPH|nr:ROK family transcriptional regulator [Hoeflea algicola]MCY0148524.1 ROK family protein [Hoeflea algicola]